MYFNQASRVIRKRHPVVIRQVHQRADSEASWMHLISRYSNGSHIHGFYQLFWPTIRQRMRLLWALALLCALAVLFYFIDFLAERHKRKLFHTVVANANWPIQNIAFPVIIVCNKNRLNWSRVPQIIKRYDISAAQQSVFERVLTAYDALSFGHFNVFEPLQELPLQALNHLNFTQIVSELAWRCDELLADCKWQTESRNCCELFRPRRLPHGACLAFNEMEQRTTVETGRNTGLVVRLMLQEALHAPGNRETKGFVLNILEPSVWSDFPISLVPDSDTFVGLKAIYHYYDRNTHSLNSQQRQCMLDYEQKPNHLQHLSGHKYMLENCQAECQQLYLLRYCNCTLDLFYPPSQHVACQLKDLPCLAAHNHLLQNYIQPNEYPYVNQSIGGLVCDCPHNCKSLTLLTDVRKRIFRYWQTVNETRRGSNRSMLLNIFYKQNFLLVYRTSLIYSWVDLIVSFGAICQLCLGCSILGLLEVIYFGLIDVPNFFWTRYTLRRVC